jgi:hypothetical protein
MLGLKYLGMPIAVSKKHVFLYTTNKNTNAAISKNEHIKK